MAQKPTKQLFADPGTIDGAVMTGCKNIAAAHKLGEYEVEVPTWGIRLRTEAAVGESLQAVGIRAHYFGLDIAENAQLIRIIDTIEEPFEWTFQFRYEGQAEDTPNIWWRISKHDMPAADINTLGVSPRDVLLLYGDTRQ